MALNLSKSKYCSAVQCPKMLWLKKYRPEEFDDSVMNQSVLDTGNEVGDLAMGLFGDYTEVPYGNLSGMIEKTSDLIENRTQIIAESSFSYNGLFCSIDILKNLGSKEVEIYEVKSSTGVKDIYYDDTAYQYYVLTMLGFTVAKVCIVHINNEYVRMGDLELDKLFHIEDVTEVAAGMLTKVKDNIDHFNKYMEQADEPNDDIGMYCFDPYDCGFFGFCTKRLPKPNIFDVAGERKPTKFRCYDKGIVSFEEIYKSRAISSRFFQQVEYELYDYPPYIEKQSIKAFLDTLSFPLYFLDFETFQPAIPLYDHSSPYQQLVFQYSLHYFEHEGGELKHKEYLAYPGKDPRRDLAEQLCADIPKNVCTTAYNMGFEKGRIRGLAELYPDLAEHLMNIHDNIQDLMIPFQRKYYYTKAMEGSYSIKYVLPALFPDDQALDYHNLEGIHNGGEASATFKNMATMPTEMLETYRGYLLKYCGLDTYAMVKVWEKLKEVVG